MLKMVPTKQLYVIGYGRFNPPTKGHEKAIFENVIKNVKGTVGDVEKYDKVYGLFITTRSNDKTKNPLSVTSKMTFLEMILRNKLSSKLKAYISNDNHTGIEQFVKNRNSYQYGLCHRSNTI